MAAKSCLQSAAAALHGVYLGPHVVSFCLYLLMLGSCHVVEDAVAAGQIV
jgi:hypothetical protein